MSVMEELLQILVAFGGGRGSDANDAVVRFLLPTFFWCVLAVVSLREWRRSNEKKDFYIGIASVLGMSRELFMFIAEYGGSRGWVHFGSLYNYYPPFEHTATMLSGIFIGYAFLNYLLQWHKLSRAFLLTASAVTGLHYLIIAPKWIDYLGRTPGAPFGSFWGDMAFRVSASIFMGCVLSAFTLAVFRGKYIPRAVFIGFAFLFLDEFLMIFNLVTDERNAHIYAPIRRNLHIWAIPIFLGVYWSDIRKRAVQAESAVDSIFRLSPSMLAVIDSKGIIRKASPASENVLERQPEELHNHSLSELGLQDGFEAAVGDLNDDGEFKDFELKYKAGDGSIRRLQWNAHFVKAENLYYAVISDITKQKKMEEEQTRLRAQLVHAQKMEAVGLLAGGVAHDFNNILTAIFGYGDILKMKLKEDKTLQSYAQHILDSAERAARLTKSLLAFSRKQILAPAPVDVNDILTNIRTLLTALIGEDIELKIAPSEECMIIQADPGQIEQVLMNIATNARDAMPDGGKLIIESRSAELDKNFVDAHGYGRPGLYAVLSLTDSGHGMNKETREKIFEPFFTTKEVGKGTGLGLSIAYGIIKQHEGYIDVRSEEGAGTNISIYLPIIHGAVQEKEQTESLSISGGRETILIAEDDAAVRILVSETLTQAGYKVIEAHNGEDAVHKFMENKDSIRLLILDVIMPKMNGKEAHLKITETRPGIKTIFFSGYTAGLIHKKGVETGEVNFIAKPVVPGELLKKVREALDNKE